MAMKSEDSILSFGMKRNAISSTETERSSASRLLLKLSCDSPTTPRRFPKKADRIMLEKSIGTMKVRRIKNETPTKAACTLLETEPCRIAISDSESALKKRENTTSIQDDDKTEGPLARKESREVGKPSDESPSSPASGTDSSSTSVSSFSPVTPLSTVVTSTCSPIVERGDSICKRIESLVRDSPRSVATSSEDRSFSREVDHDDLHSEEKGPCMRSLSISAAHQRKTKLDRPMPRKMRDPGHSAPILSTSKVAVSTSGVFNSNQSLTTSTTTTASLSKTPELVDSNTSTKADDVIHLQRGDTTTVVSTMSMTSRIDTTDALLTRTKSIKSKPSISRTASKAQEEGSTPVPVIVAHNEDKQWLLDDNGIAKGVQFEIARGITQGWWAWEDITEGVVERLRGTNFEKAGRVGEMIKKGPKEHASRAVLATRQAIYAELDREQRAFVENKGRGLGLMGTWDGKENWYGGCVQFTCKLEFQKDGGNGDLPFTIRLNSLSTGKSTRAARLATSLSILQLKFEKGALYDGEKYQLVLEHLSRGLVICGRKYRTFCVKEDKVFFVEIKEDFQRKPSRSMGDKYRFSYRNFIKAINPMELNTGQAMNKWLARWHLMLSTSRPVLEFQPENIYLDLDDIYGGDGQIDKKRPETIMTDGCGWINLSALRCIAAILNVPFPGVIQGRLAGTKGLWNLHPAPEHRTDSEPPKIWIRPSQLKIKLPPKETWHRSLRIFDLVRLPRLTVPSSLNAQIIMNMSHNGVKDVVFSKLMEVGLKKEIEPLTKWDGDHACVELAKAVEEAGGIMSSRRARGAGGEARLYSYVRDENDDDDGDDITNKDGLVERDSISGLSSSLYESTRDLLLAGFNPLRNAVVREKLRYILTQTTKFYLEQHIPVPLSAEAFIVPDPYDVLEEGQIYFRCSTAIGDPTVAIDPHTFLGPVLVSRNPTRVASDIRKVVAVSHDQLLSYTDVIIFSTKGDRSLASYLGGGDYDGDTVTIIADPLIVDGFSNSKHVPEPPSVRAAFQEEVETVSTFLEKSTEMEREAKYNELSKKVLGGLSDNKVGLYSNMHDNAIFSTGYNSEDAIRLAFMFTTCLDATKSGLRIKNDVFKSDSKKWNRPKPECMQKAEESIRRQDSDATGAPLSRPAELGPFVLISLKKFAKELGDKALIDYEKLIDMAQTSGPQLDDDIASSYEDMKQYAIQMQEHGCTGPLKGLDTIEAFIKSLCDQYVSELGAHFRDKDEQKHSSKRSTVKAKTTAQVKHEFAKKFEDGLSDCFLHFPSDSVTRAKASYAYIYGTEKKSIMGREFGFAVAQDTLCAIKRLKNGGGSISRDCRDYTLVSSSLVRLVCD